MTKEKLYELFKFTKHPEVPSDGTEGSIVNPAIDTGEGFNFYEVKIENPNDFSTIENLASKVDGDCLIANITSDTFYIACKGACYTGTKLF